MSTEYRLQMYRRLATVITDSRKARANKCDIVVTLFINIVTFHSTILIEKNNYMNYYNHAREMKAYK